MLITQSLVRELVVCRVGSGCPYLRVVHSEPLVAGEVGSWCARRGADDPCHAGWNATFRVPALRGRHLIRVVEMMWRGGHNSRRATSFLYNRVEEARRRGLAETGRPLRLSDVVRDTHLSRGGDRDPSESHEVMEWLQAVLASDQDLLSEILRDWLGHHGPQRRITTHSRLGRLRVLALRGMPPFGRTQIYERGGALEIRIFEERRHVGNAGTFPDMPLPRGGR